MRTCKCQWLAIVILVFAAIRLTDVSAGEQTSPPPNVVLIISDDHGWTDYGFLNHPQVQTPNLDRLASQSLVFRRGYVPTSLCCPSLAAIITGLYPHQNKITCNDPPPAPRGMKPGEYHRSALFLEGREVMTRHLEAVPTLPRLLAEQGYVSLQTGKWWQSDYRRGGFTHGMTKGQRHGDEGLDIGRKTMQPIFDFVRDAQNQKKPFFVWYAPMMPHDPHTPPERLLAEVPAEDPVAARRPLLGDGRMVRRDLRPTAGLPGPAAAGGEHDRAVPGRQRLDAEPGKARPNAVEADALRRRPADADHGPLARQSGAENERRIGHVHRPRPHAADRLGTKTDAGHAGRQFAGCGRGGGAEGDLRRVFYAQRRGFERPGSESAVPLDRRRRWKLILPAGQAETKKTELYDILADPQEQKDVAEENSEIIATLSRKLDGWWKP